MATKNPKKKPSRKNRRKTWQTIRVVAFGAGMSLMVVDFLWVISFSKTQLTENTLIMFLRIMSVFALWFVNWYLLISIQKHD